MEENKNNFRNVIDVSPKKEKQHTIKNNIIVPFISGVLGCGVVIGTCFGVPSIKQSLIGTSAPMTSASITSNSDVSSGTVDFVSLNTYSDTAVYAANKILPSIVGIEITYNMNSTIFGMFGNNNSQTTAKSSGSGIIISEDGYILTNNHVVDSQSQSTYYEISEATSIKVTLSTDNTEYDATIVGKDSQTDLAVLKIDATNLTAAEFADSDSVKVGEFAMAVGNPLDLGSTITCGVISAVNRVVEDSDSTTSYTCIQTDAAINSGNSGGALVNSEGKVIGVNTLKISSTGVEGIGFAIPINSTQSVINDLITYNKVRRPYIGISGRDLNENTAKQYNLVEGIYIVSVEEYGAAEKAGLKAGDIIVKIDSQDVKTMDELNTIKNTHSIGDEITLSIYRDGKYKDISLTLGESN